LTFDVQTVSRMPGPCCGGEDMKQKNVRMKVSQFEELQVDQTKSRLAQKEYTDSLSLFVNSNFISIC